MNTRKSYFDKAMLVHRKNIYGAVKLWGIGEGKSAFLTKTFNEKEYSKVKAGQKKNNWDNKFRRMVGKFDFICVAETHDKGGYHFHYLIHFHDVGMSMKRAKEAIRIIRFEGFIQIKWTYGREEEVAYYLTKYMTKENMNRIQGHFISYSNKFPRVANIRFSWVGTAWQRDWNVASCYVGYSRELVIKYYDRVFRRCLGDRLELLRLWREKKYDEFLEYIRCGIRDYIVKSPQKHLSDIKHNLIVLEGICVDSQKFDSELEIIPF